MLIGLGLAVAVLPAPREFAFTGGFAKDPAVTEARDATLPAEGYRMSVGKDGVKIAAADERGGFYARMTLRQMTEDGRVPCAEVKDWPEYPFRSIMIDEGRHFFGKAFMMKTLELMARYKFNTLHWHLTEDQGWRIAIDRYPELTKIGATRLETAVRGRYTGKYDGTTYGPYFYTKDEIREVVKRATELKIDIIPEIEMPGHCRSVIAAYPELACPTAKLGRRTCWTDWGICDDVVCVSNPKVLEFYKNVIDEVCELFPGKRFHTGGDEVTGVQWKACPRCQAKMKELGFANVMQLQGWFTQRIYEYLTDVKGREFGGWSAVFANGTRLDPKKCYAPGGCANNQVWCAMAGYPTVASPVEYMYWDFNQGLNDADKVVYGTWWSGSITLSDVYAFDPRRGLVGAARKNLIGGEAHNWSEYTYSVPDLEWKIWPRAIALAQALWNPQSGYSYREQFLPVVKKHIVQLRNEGVNCADAFEGYSCATTGGASADNQVVNAYDAAGLPAREALVEKGWRQWLNVPAKYADFKREVKPTAKYAFPDFDVECYEQRNGPDTAQRVMMAIPKNVKGKCPAAVAPFYFPEAMLGFNPADGGLESDLVKDGTNLTYYSEISYMSDLARRGYITVSADAYHLTYRNHEEPWWSCSWPLLDFLWSNPWQRVGDALNEDWPEWTGIGKLTFDTRLLVDLLCADRRVDASRIGIIGHSLGGKMAFYAGCLDSRIKVIVASDFGIGWGQTNWNADWYWGAALEKVRVQGFDNSVLLEASGGKPFCLIAGKYDNEDTGRTVRRIHQYGQTPSLFKFVNHATGHRPPRWATEEGYRFLDQHLKCKSNKEEKK